MATQDISEGHRPHAVDRSPSNARGGSIGMVVLVAIVLVGAAVGLLLVGRGNAARLLAALLLVVPCGAGLARADEYSTARLLLDLARDHGLMCAGRQCENDVLHIRALLEAALALDPDLSDAHFYRFELAELAGDVDASAAALQALVAADPGHFGALARWLDRGPARMTRIEDRLSWLAGQSGQLKSPEARVIALTQQARLELERLDRQAAARLTEEAAKLGPDDDAVAVLQFMLLPTDAAPAERIRALLRVVRLHPLDPELCWQLAELLDQQRQLDAAASFHQHAQRVLDALGLPPEPQRLLEAALNAAARGAIDDALRAAREALALDELDAPPVLEWLLRRAQRNGEAEVLRARLAERFAAIKDADVADAAEVTRAAWFHCTLDPQPQRAAMLAASAVRRAPGDRRVQRVLGVSQLLNEQPDAARETLAPLLDSDAWAAAALARALRDSGDLPAARQTLRKARLPVSGPVMELAASLEIASTTAPSADAGLSELLRGVSLDQELRGVLDDAASVLDVELAPENLSPRVGEPWWATLTLTNRGALPVTLGQDALINPVVLLSFEISGRKARSYPNLFATTLSRARSLRPGESVRTRLTLDVGPPRRVARLAPHELLRVSVSAILNPQMGADGEWKPGLIGKRLRPVYFNRLPIGDDPAELNALFDAVGGGRAHEQYRSVVVLAQLLGADQRASRSASRFPRERAISRLLAALASESWELRARTLDALQAAGLDERLHRAAQRCSTDEHWLVRFLAVRLLARQGAAYASEAERIASADTDARVRMLARSLADAARASAAHAPSSAPADDADGAASTAPASLPTSQPAKPADPSRN